ncbi:unnamed protein product, partial [marine sediment metagenome]
MKMMDVKFSVFNQHINNAEQRTREIMRGIAPKYLMRVDDIKRKGNGIMAIFEYSPSDEPATMMYASMVAAFVNDSRT